MPSKGTDGTSLRVFKGSKETVKYYSMTDAYGLGLIAKNPTRDWTRVKQHLSEDARKIAEEMTSPGRGSREVQAAAKDLIELAEKIRNSPAV